jgi:hypothetical protein
LAAEGPAGLVGPSIGGGLLGIGRLEGEPTPWSGGPLAAVGASIGGGLLGTSRVGGRSEGAPTPRSDGGPPDTAEPVSDDDAVPGSLAMSGDGAEGAGSIVKVGPEGSGSLDTTDGDASALTTIAASPTMFSPRPPTMAAPATHRLVFMGRPLSGDRRARRSILVIVVDRLDELWRLAGSSWIADA